MESLPAQPLRLSSLALFGAFFQAGLMGFGGVLPMIRRVMVEDRKWLTPAEFNELISLCQFLPGANVANMAVIFGSRVCGPQGSVAALLGLLGAPVAIVLVIAELYARYGELAPVRHMVTGLSAGAAGLILATALKIAMPLRTSPLNLVVAALAFAALGIVRLPFLPSLCVLVPLSMVLAGWKLRA
ncbi:chromate transporter [Acidisoma cellulosilytica]|uniref:Chromate transporter n=1 Tax=Acidisoma cellulosilyticum TaxID=2802395 RepID=A0A964E557_9PROT|nr:chromate transporter [Acidisoma cellulosilyticum]MCB8881643.1 chromate transporter [Acidisoma cellulosilyticum]